jgi:hypothetical protein
MVSGNMSEILTPNHFAKNLKEQISLRIQEQNLDTLYFKGIMEEKTGG